jgi:hypothetical protein
MIEIETGIVIAIVTETAIGIEIAYATVKDLRDCAKTGIVRIRIWNVKRKRKKSLRSSENARELLGNVKPVTKYVLRDCIISFLSLNSGAASSSAKNLPFFKNSLLSISFSF